MPLTKVNVFEAAKKLEQPLSVTNLAQVDDFLMRVFLCQGAVGWHRHEDQDELFFVQSGEIILESERGSVLLSPGEMAAAPKWVAHRSRSVLRSIVLLFEGTFTFARRNGDRHTPSEEHAVTLPKVDVRQVAQTLTQPFSTAFLLRVDDCTVRVARAAGQAAWQTLTWNELAFVMDGEAVVETAEESAALSAGDLVVLDKGGRYRWAAPLSATLVLFGKQSDR